MVGCSLTGITKKMDKYGIPRNDAHNDNKKHEVVSKIDKEEFRKLFIDEAKTYKEMAEHFGCSERQLQRLNSEKFKIKRDHDAEVKFQQKKLASALGVSEEDALNEITKKARVAYKEKSGYENPSYDPAVLEKRKEVFLEKYEVENPFQAEEVKEKIKQTLQERYGEGVINPSQAESLRKKIGNAIQISKLQDHVSEENLNMLLSKDEFSNYILSLPEDERNYASIGKKLNIDETTVAKHILNFDLNDIIKSKKSTSSYEQELVDFLNLLGITNIERNTKKYLDGKEIDIYIPDLKIGIEFNGNYWHSEEFLQQNYHQDKALLAESKGIFIYQIFEYEWESNKEKIKSHLKHILGKDNSKVVYARNCILKQITKDEKKKFLDDYHLQGNDRSLYEFGLFYKNELIMVMTFCKARFTHDQDWELSRMCIKSGYSVVGGASKLFKYFIKNYMNVNDKIVTYNDLCKSRGGVYEKLGFTKLRVSDPSYVWFKSHCEILSRYKCQIKDEINVMKGKGYHRIFDGGNNVWNYTKLN